MCGGNCASQDICFLALVEVIEVDCDGSTRYVGRRSIYMSQLRGKVQPVLQIHPHPSVMSTSH